MLRAGQRPVVAWRRLILTLQGRRRALNTALCNKIFSTGGHTSTNFTRWKCIRGNFFCRLDFFLNSRADFCHITSVKCRERGATLIFSLRLLLDSGISVACSLKDCLPEIVTQVFPSSEGVM